MLKTVSKFFTNLAFDLIGLCHDGVEISVRCQPLCSCLGPTTRHTGDIVRGIPNQRKIINNLSRLDAKFFLNTCNIHRGVAHGIDERDVFVDQLSHVLVASRDDRFQPRLRRLHRQGTDNIVRFHAFNDHEWKTHLFNQLVQRLHLRTHIIRHALPIRLVLTVEIIAKGFALGIEHNDHDLRRIIRDQTTQHVNHTVNCTCRLLFAVSQRRHGMKCAIQIGGTIDQHHRSLSGCVSGFGRTRLFGRHFL